MKSVQDKIGILLIGLHGCTANTLLLGLLGSKGPALGSIIDASLQDLFPFITNKDIVFGGWDILDAKPADIARKYCILPEEVIKAAEFGARDIYTMRGIAGPYDVDEASRLRFARHPKNQNTAINHLRSDIREFKKKNNLSHSVVIYLGPPLKDTPDSIERLSYSRIRSGHQTNNLPSGVLYALAAIEEGCAFVDFTPNSTLEVQCVTEAASMHRVPLAGRDGNTGQSLLKTVLAPMFRQRNLKINGWYSTNILGNNDGKILIRPDHKKLKIHDKTSILNNILPYSDFEHVVTIDYYRPRGDNKESWDNIDFVGWLGLPMQMKINWLGRDSILAGPVLWDIIRHMEAALRFGCHGMQGHLAAYFKHPLGTDVFEFPEQVRMLTDFYKSRT